MCVKVTATGQTVTVTSVHYSCKLSPPQQQWHLDLFNAGCSHSSAGDSKNHVTSQASNPHIGLMNALMNALLKPATTFLTASAKTDNEHMLGKK